MSPNILPSHFLPLLDKTEISLSRKKRVKKISWLCRKTLKDTGTVVTMAVFFAILRRTQRWNNLHLICSVLSTWIHFHGNGFKKIHNKFVLLTKQKLIVQHGPWSMDPWL